MGNKKIIIGTRGSDLSRIQTNYVKDLLQKYLPKTTIEIITITTAGDKNMSPIPLDTIGKGWFTKEIDRQLLDGKIDIAVHSLKDLLDTLTPGLTIAAIPDREDASEALVTRNGKVLQTLKKGAVIGTDSIRRKIQILSMRNDLIVKSIRGNVNKRLEKLDAGEYDGVCLAVAGLNRLGLQKRIAEYFSPTDFIPSPGQGALAVVSKKTNKQLNAVLSKLNNSQTIAAVTAERTFSKITGGGCSMPVGAYAEIKKKKLILSGMIASEDGKHIVKDVISGKITEPKEIARKLATKLLKQSSSWYHTQKIVLTREKTKNKKFAKQLEIIGLPSFSFPSIAVSKNLTTKAIKKYFSDMSSYDWILFTSSNGVKFFMEGLQNTGQDRTVLNKIRIAAVGSKTAETAEKLGLHVSFVPTTFTASDATNELKKIKGKKILLPRSTIAQKEIIALLEKKGATVTAMPLYKTTFVEKPTKEFEQLLMNNSIRCLTFTSPSTVKGFLKNTDKIMHDTVKSIPVFSIGPITTAAAKKLGFTKIYTAKTHTVEGMITKLKENIL